MALEHGSVELDLVGGPLGVHFPAVPKEVLGVPELGLNLGINIHGFKDILALLFGFAISAASHWSEVLTGVENEEEVVALAFGVSCRLVLELDGVTLHVRAPISLKLLPEHGADFVLVVESLALDGLPVG